MFDAEAELTGSRRGCSWQPRKRPDGTPRLCGEKRPRKGPRCDSKSL